MCAGDLKITGSYYLDSCCLDSWFLYRLAAVKIVIRVPALFSGFEPG